MTMLNDFFSQYIYTILKALVNDNYHLSSEQNLSSLLLNKYDEIPSFEFLYRKNL